jgi:hypothetical protein
MNAFEGIFGLFLLACAYSAQYWAKKCHDVLCEIRDNRRTDLR